MELSGYALETLREGRDFALYRARESGNLVSILVRAPLRGLQTAASLARLEHEYALAGELDPAWAALPLALARQDGHRVLVLEDAGGDPLETNPRAAAGAGVFSSPRHCRRGGAGPGSPARPHP